MRMLFVGTRVLAAVAVIVAIVAQLRSSLDFAGRDGDRDTGNVLVNFFGYFTVDSNALSAVLLVVGAFVLLGRRADTRAYAVTRASVTTYMVITGLVYNLLLRAAS